MNRHRKVKEASLKHVKLDRLKVAPEDGVSGMILQMYYIHTIFPPVSSKKNLTSSYQLISSFSQEGKAILTDYPDISCKVFLVLPMSKPIGKRIYMGNKSTKET